jgi:mRNA interferase MazF
VSEQQLEPRAGEVWLVDCDPRVGREQGGIRPALVISNDYFNRLPNGLYVIVPLTTRNRGLRLHIPIFPSEGGLRQPSVIMCDQVKAASERRMLEHWGTVSAETLAATRQLVGLILEGKPFIEDDGEQSK